jgi:hypothetical protein
MRGPDAILMYKLTEQIGIEQCFSAGGALTLGGARQVLGAGGVREHI